MHADTDVTIGTTCTTAKPWAQPACEALSVRRTAGVHVSGADGHGHANNPQGACSGLGNNCGS